MLILTAPEEVRGIDFCAPRIAEVGTREVPCCLPVVDLRPAEDFGGRPVTRRGVWASTSTVKADEGMVCWTKRAKERIENFTYAGNVAVDWSHPAALDCAIRWLADRGHLCGWMRPRVYGGCVDDHGDLPAWVVSAILVARSVGEVAAGRVPPRTVARAFGVPTNARMSNDNIGGATIVWSATEESRDYFEAPRWCPDEHNDGANLTPKRPGWVYARGSDHRTVRFGPEVGQAAVDRINAVALADGCALLVPGGVALSTLEGR